jgi:hypothetical protein
MEGTDILIRAINSKDYADGNSKITPNELKIIYSNSEMKMRYDKNPALFENIKEKLRISFRHDGDSRFKAMLYKSIKDNKFDAFVKSLDSVFNNYKPPVEDVECVDEITYHLGTYFHIQCVIAIIGIAMIAYSLSALNSAEQNLVSRDLASIGVVIGIVLAYIGSRNAYKEYIVYAEEPHWLLSKIFV